VSNSLLFLAVIALVLPLAATRLPDIDISDSKLLIFSRVIAIVLIIAYAAYLYFQLISHHDVFASVDDEDAEQPALTITAEVGILFALSIIVSLASECVPGRVGGVCTRGLPALAQLASQPPLLQPFVSPDP